MYMYAAPFEYESIILVVRLRFRRKARQVWKLNIDLFPLRSLLTQLCRKTSYWYLFEQTELQKSKQGNSPTLSLTSWANDYQCITSFNWSTAEEGNQKIQFAIAVHLKCDCCCFQMLVAKLSLHFWRTMTESRTFLQQVLWLTTETILAPRVPYCWVNWRVFKLFYKRQSFNLRVCMCGLQSNRNALC